MQTLIFADRGLYARWLFEKIVALERHPFLRVYVGGTFRPEGKKRCQTMRTFCPLGQARAAQRDAALNRTLNGRPAFRVLQIPGKQDAHSFCRALE